MQLAAKQIWHLAFWQYLVVWHCMLVSCTLISNIFDLLQKGCNDFLDDQIRMQSGRVSIEMRLKGLLKCTVVCCVQTEQTRVVQRCILMPLSSQIRAVEERLDKSKILLQKQCRFLHPALISVLELTTWMKIGVLRSDSRPSSTPYTHPSCFSGSL